MVGTASRCSRFLFIATPAQSLLMSNEKLLYMHYTHNYILFVDGHTVYMYVSLLSEINDDDDHYYIYTHIYIYIYIYIYIFYI